MFCEGVMDCERGARRHSDKKSDFYSDARNDSAWKEGAGERARWRRTCYPTTYVCAHEWKDRSFAIEATDGRPPEQHFLLTHLVQPRLFFGEKG